MLNNISKLRELPESRRRHILYACMAIVAVLLILAWIITMKFGKSNPGPQGANIGTEIKNFTNTLNSQ